MKTPVNLITGFLGVGKTTALLHLLAQRPAGSRWAVLVNEFGQVGIDGATLSQSGVAVREVPGGCICCTAQVPLRVALTRLLREQKPQRVLVEPTGLGHPAGAIDALRGERLGDALTLQNVLCLVDPRQLSDERYTRLETYRDQIALADVLVANKCDLASAAQLQHFETFAAQCYPPKRIVAQVAHGRLEPDWLNERLPSRYPWLRDTTHQQDTQQFETRAWTFTIDHRFDADKLRMVFENWVQQGQVERAKGVLRCGRDWRLFHLAAGQVTQEPMLYRSESRLDVIVRVDQQMDWDSIEQAIQGALTRGD